MSSGYTLTPYAMPAGAVAVTSNGSLLVAVGSNNAIFTSTDGKTWTTRAGPSTTSTTSWHKVIWAGTFFVAVANYSSASMTSPDGITWTAGAMPNSAVWNGLAWNGSLIVAVSGWNGSSLNGGDICTSTDGLTWVTRVTASGFDHKAVAWGGGTFVAVGAENRVKTSPDGITWTYRSYNANYPLWYDVTYAGSVFVRVGDATRSTADQSCIATSPDGITWTSVFTGAQLFAVAATSNIIVAVGDNAYELSSTDGGATWSRDPTTYTGSGNPRFTSITAHGANLVAVANLVAWLITPPVPVTPAFWTAVSGATETP